MGGGREMNTTLGEIVCPLCGESAELRRCKSGAKTWYWICRCGKITPNLPAGQQWIMDRAVLFPPASAGASAGVVDKPAGASASGGPVKPPKTPRAHKSWFDWDSE